MFKPVAAAMLIFAVSVPSARADLEEFVRICGGAKSSPHDIVHFCRKAIETKLLNRKARAQVYANMAIGYFELQQYLGAVDAADKALSADPQLAAAYLYRARANDRLDKVVEAAEDYEKALILAPNSADIYLARGIMMLRRGQPYPAVTDLSKALIIQPDSGTARYNRGIAYLEIGQPSRAEEDFSRMIKDNPNDAEAHLYRGQARAKLNDPNAAKDFDRAIELKQEWGLAWFVRGRYRDGIGQKEAANGDFLRANELGHNDPWLIERVRQLGG